MITFDKQRLRQQAATTLDAMQVLADLLADLYYGDGDDAGDPILGELRPYIAAAEYALGRDAIHEVGDLIKAIDRELAEEGP